METTTRSLSEGTNNTTEHEELTIHDGIDPLFIGLLSVVALFVGILIRLALRKLPIPYTLLCLIFGLALGEIAFRNDLSGLGNSIDSWIQLDPHTILFLFLPPLIFESASSMDYHTFRFSIYQSLVLAVPGVIISAILTSLIGQHVLPYNWDFATGMTLGSILAATDPVAVVALLREIGAPRTLSTIIEGESLLNDGVAFVLFQFFLTELQGESQSTGDFFAAFFYKALVAPLVGYVLGEITVFLMGLIFDDRVSIIMLSIAGALGAFYIVEAIEASGVLGVVAFGVAFASHRSGNVSHEASEALHTVWESLGFLANTLVFVYSGIIIVNFGFHTDTVTLSDYGYLLLLYLLIQFVRAFTILLLSPILARLGYGFNWQEGALFSWSGLRGAVGLTLGLFIVNDTAVDENNRRLIMFYVAGIAFLTLLINGTTAGWLVRSLKLDRSSAAAKFFYDNVLARFKDRVESTIAVARRDEYFRGSDWEKVWTRMPILSKDMQRLVEKRVGGSLNNRIMKKTRRYFRAVDDGYCKATPEEVQRTLIQDARHRFLNLVKSMYNSEFQHGALQSRPSFQVLVDAATAAQDRCDDVNLEWREVKRYGEVPRWFNLIKIPAIKHVMVDWRLELGYELAAIFIKVHLAVEHEFAELIDNDEIASIVLSESHDQVHAAQLYLDDMNTNFADITGAFKTRWASQWVLRDAWVFAQDLKESGEIEEKEYNAVIRGINRSRGVLFRARFGATKPIKTIQVLRGSDFFDKMESSDIEKIIGHFQEKEYLPEELLAVEGDPCKGVFVITNGQVNMSAKVQGQDRELRRLTAGAILGDHSIVTNSPNRWTLTCATNVRGYFIRKSRMIEFLHEHEDKQFERNVYFHAGISILQCYHVLETNNSFTPEQTNALLQVAELIRPYEGETVTMDESYLGILFTGRCCQLLEDESSTDEAILDNPEANWITGCSRVDFTGTWNFRDKACLMRIPLSIMIAMETEGDSGAMMREDHRFAGRSRSQSVVDLEQTTSYRNRPRARTSSVPNIGYILRTPSRVGNRASRASRRSSRSLVHSSSSLTPRTPTKMNFDENPLMGISNINLRKTRGATIGDSSSSDDEEEEEVSLIEINDGSSSPWQSLESPKV